MQIPSTTEPPASNQLLKIAIDGPAGAGKSTVAKQLAKQLNLLYIDTGAMYRAAAWIASQSNIDLKEGKEIAKELQARNLEFHAGPEKDKVLVDKIDISKQIRSPEISAKVSFVAVHPEVRAFLMEQQRIMASKGNCVLDGRDIGTVVLPDAAPKIFLTATKEERARRRVRDLESMGKTQSYDEVLEALVERDTRDSKRDEAPLVKAEDAIEVITDGLSIDQVVQKIVELVSKVKGIQ